MKFQFLFVFCVLILGLQSAFGQQSGDFSMGGGVGYAVSEEQEGLSLDLEVGHYLTSLIALKAGYTRMDFSYEQPDMEIDYTIDKYSVFGETFGYFNSNVGISGILGGSYLSITEASENETALGLDIGSKLRYTPSSRFEIGLKILNNFNTVTNYVITASLSLEYRLRL